MIISLFASHFGTRGKKAPIFFLDYIPVSSGLVKLGQPVPELNLSNELNNGSPETISTYIPSLFVIIIFILKGGSVPFFCVNLNIVFW